MKETDVFNRKSKWIYSGALVVDKNTGYLSPATEFRKTFEVEKIENAECKIIGLGAFSLFINGKRVHNDILSPAFTVYDKRTLFVRYDVTDYLRIGENVVAVKLGDGFYNQTTKDTWGFYQASWRATQRLLLEITQGEKVLVLSDDEWKARTDGATYHSAIRSGEYYDARKDDGWKEVGYDDEKWGNAVIAVPPGGETEEMKIPPIRECEYLTATDIFKSESGFIFDFGKNVSGYVRMRLKAERGREISFHYAEKLTDGKIDVSNIDCYVDGCEFSVDKYTFKGEGEESWSPEFVYHGFRYVEVRGLKEKPEADSITAVFVHTDLKRVGNFHSSNELLNWIYDAGIRSLLSNWHGFSEDCPHREKNGWTGDAAISCNYAVFNFDMKEAYKKWLKDMIDCQRSNGQLSCIAPSSGWGYNWGSGPAWDIAFFSLPYELYLETGDTECLNLIYEHGKKYLEYAKYYRKNGLVDFGLGDWCPPSGFSEEELNIMSVRLASSCHYYKIQRIMGDVARLNGLFSEADDFDVLAEETRSAIEESFAPSADSQSGQGSLAILLYFDIVKGEKGEVIAKKLAETVERDEYAFKVGILGAKAILNALSAYGYTDVAYKMANNRNYPSYGYWMESGQTTLLENWDMSNSRNHHMFGDVTNWIVREVGGLKNTGIAYDKCSVKPYFFDDNCFALCEKQTAKGKIFVKWEKCGKTFTIETEIPVGVTAELILPHSQPVRLSSGKLEVNLKD